MYRAIALLLCVAGCGGRGQGVGDGGEEDLTFTLPTDLARPMEDFYGVHFNKDAACAQVSAAAVLEKRPIDILFVIDNSGSMTDEIVAVQDNINASFAQIIAASGIDWRVILIARHGDAKGDQAICVTMPLSGNPTCTPPPQKPTNTATFFHYSVEVASHDSLNLILSTYDGPDEFGLAPKGWKDWLRPSSVKVFVEITDDESMMSAGNFEGQLFAKTGKVFGGLTNRLYVFHTIAGLKENNPPTMAWGPQDPLQQGLCVNGGGAVAPGVEYQKLSMLTGGLRFPICEHASFDAVFQAVAQGVVKGAEVACEFDIPPAPGMEKIDLSSVIVDYTPGDGGMMQSFSQVADVGQCGPGLFYIDVARGKIVLCPATCTAVKNDLTAKIAVLFDCLPPIM